MRRYVKESKVLFKADVCFSEWPAAPAAHCTLLVRQFARSGSATRLLFLRVAAKMCGMHAQVREREQGAVQGRRLR